MEFESKFLNAGDKVRCISYEDGWTLPDGTDIDGPTLGDILTVRKTAVTIDNGQLVGSIWFDEYEGDGPDDCFDAEEFELA